VENPHAHWHCGKVVIVANAAEDTDITNAYNCGAVASFAACLRFSLLRMGLLEFLMITMSKLCRLHNQAHLLFLWMVRAAWDM
jgi:hypothetical protein